MKRILALALCAALICSAAAALAQEEELLHGKCFTIMTEGGDYIAPKEAAADSSPLLAGNTASLWTFLFMGEGAYAIVNEESKKAFDVPAASVEEGEAITQYAQNGGDNQTFYLIENEDGTVSFCAKHSSLYVTERDGALTQRQKGESGQSFTLAYVKESEIKTMGLGVMLFARSGSLKAINAKLQWNSAAAADYYALYRSDGGEYEEIAQVKSLCYDDYDLEVGKTYTYRVRALTESGAEAASAQSKEVTAYDLEGEELKTFDNVNFSWLQRPNTLFADGVYYRFSQRSRTDGPGFGSLVVETSVDDINYANEMEVLSIEDVLSHPSAQGLENAKFESNNFVYNPQTNMFYWWAHYENTWNYNEARVSVAYGKPGERFTYGGCYRPMGDDARDMHLYIDDDNRAYAIAAVYNNADLAVYSLTEDWTAIEERIAFVSRGRWRELPSVIKVDGLYYMFTSGTAGWYPTQCMYSTATSMAGPWSELRSVGNTTTFSSQSGSVSALYHGGFDNYSMVTYRWMYYWDDAIHRRTANRLLPISLSNGFAFFDIYRSVKYNYDKNLLLPVQSGRILSDGKTASATSGNESARFACDGDYATLWQGEEWGAVWSVDLQDVYSLSEIQISWSIRNGAEAYYDYVVEGSEDGENYSIILDRTLMYNDYGFTIEDLCGARARYVRVHVTDAHVRSGENTYLPQMYEVKILGE